MGNNRVFPINKNKETDKALVLEAIEKEKILISEELKNSGKPENIINKISLGKINKFKEDNSLMTQPWVMEPKKKVKDIIDNINNKTLEIKEFIRIKIGE